MKGWDGKDWHADTQVQRINKYFTASKHASKDIRMKVLMEE